MVLKHKSQCKSCILNASLKCPDMELPDSSYNVKQYITSGTGWRRGGKQKRRARWDMRVQNMSDDDDTEGNGYRTSAQEVNMEK